MQRWRLSISVLAVLMMSGVGCGRPDTGANADIAPASSHERSTAKAGNSRSFSLIDQHGKLVTEETFRGEWLIVFFGFTHCADFCPTTLYRVSAALKELGEEARNVRVVFITIDPERDTPELLKIYLKPFGEGFTGLGGQCAAGGRSDHNFPDVFTQAACSAGRVVLRRSQHVTLRCRSRWLSQSSVVV